VLVHGARGVRPVVEMCLQERVQVEFDISSHTYNQYFLGPALCEIVVRLFSGAPELMALGHRPVDVPDFLA